MKKLLLATLFVFTAATSYADQPIAPESLPENIKSFVANTFPGAAIVFAEQDMDSIEIKLNNGAEIDYDKMSNSWKDIKSYANFPVKVLPEAVVNAVKNAHPQAMIVKAEKQFNGYEIQTNTNMEILVNDKGQIMGQKFDD